MVTVSVEHNNGVGGWKYVATLFTRPTDPPFSDIESVGWFGQYPDVEAAKAAVRRWKKQLVGYRRDRPLEFVIID